MPTVTNLFEWAAERETARIEAALAVVNAGTRPDDGRNSFQVACATRTINSRCYVWPTPAKVAALVASHGLPSARERWGYVGDDELERLARKGARDLQP